MITIDEERFRSLLEMPDAIPLLEESFRVISGGAQGVAIREVVQEPQKSMSALILGGYEGAMDAFCLKMVGRFNGRQTQTLVLIDAKSGEPEGVIVGGYVCDFRTGAATAAATRVLARPDAEHLAVIGTGAQAVTQLQGVLAVRPIREITVWNRTRSRGQAWIERMQKELGPQSPPIRFAVSVADAVADADIVCVATSAQSPVLQGEWLRAGTHINAVGAGAAFQRELDGSVLLKADLIAVDVRASALQVGDFVEPLSTGVIAESSIAEIGEIMLEHRPGREGAQQITLFKSVGHVANDVAIARAALAKIKDEV